MKVDVLSAFLGGSCLPSAADCRLRIVGVFVTTTSLIHLDFNIKVRYIRNVVCAGLLQIARAMIL